jgi:hypothetical protein
MATKKENRIPKPLQWAIIALVGFLVFYFGMLGTAWALLHVKNFYFYWSFGMAAVPSYLATDLATHKLFNRLDITIGKYGILHFVIYLEMILSTALLAALIAYVVQQLLREYIEQVLLIMYPLLVGLVALYYTRVYRPSRIGEIVTDQIARGKSDPKAAAEKLSIGAPELVSLVTAPVPSKKVAQPKRSKPGLGSTFVGGCIVIAAVLGLLSIAGLYYGIATAAQGFGGLALAILSLAFIETDVKQHPKRFIGFQALFVSGISLVAPIVQKGAPFSTATSFEVGSFSLLVTGFFIASDREEYHNVLLVSIAATTALFIGGMLSAFRDVAGDAAPSAGIGGVTAYLVTALFLMGAVDLTLLLVLLLRIVVYNIRASRPSPPSLYGLDPVG